MSMPERSPSAHEWAVLCPSIDLRPDAYDELAAYIAAHPAYRSRELRETGEDPVFDSSHWFHTELTEREHADVRREVFNRGCQMTASDVARWAYEEESRPSPPASMRHVPAASRTISYRRRAPVSASP